FFTLAWQAATGRAGDRDLTEELDRTYPAPPRPESFATPTQALHFPDPLYGDGGWPEGIRRALEDPDWAAGVARRHQVEEEYQAALEEFSGLLFRLPDPAPDSTLREISTSATGLVTYAQCPKKFFWTAVDPLPRSYSYATRRGTRIHRQIELHHQGKVPLLEPDDEFRELTGDDRPVDSPDGDHPFDVFLKSRFSKMKVQWLEKGFTLRLGEEVLVRGRIDAVYQTESGGWEIVDFKSGRAPGDDPHGARVAQMQVYALAVREIPELGPAPADLSVTIAYLGGGRLAESPSAQPVDAEWLAAAYRRLKDMAGSMCDEQWDPTPSAECGGCDFFRVCPEGKAFIASSGRKP
ncbi:MAG: PD-(D/E)XK nuclease family protein, partial [bacterium]|nr:PD-(D/E)XK nuclease family protein [bacterium]